MWLALINKAFIIDIIYLDNPFDIFFGKLKKGYSADINHGLLFVVYEIYSRVSAMIFLKKRKKICSNL